MSQAQGKISKLFAKKHKSVGALDSPIMSRGPLGRQENRPKVKEVLVTYSTEENLFRILKPRLEAELCKQSFVDDQYKDGNVSLLQCKIKFEKFAPETYEKFDTSFFNHNKFLFGTPLIHLFFTSSNEISWYNRSTKNDIKTWLMALEQFGYDNWILVHVTQHASTLRKNALSNINNVINTIKEDIASTSPSSAKKFYQLTLPEKGDQATEKHYDGFITFLFTTMKKYFISQTDRYETLLSMTREDQDKPLWNFFHYFLMQEQLCFAYEHMGMYQAALLAYDEIDAMLHYLIIKMSMNKMKKSRWFETLQHCCQEVLLDYPHITLSLDQSHDPSLENKTCSLFKLRSVIFERQATLLFILGQAWDVGQRALKLLKDLSEESSSMQLPIPTGALDAWSYLMCKNVLDVILDQLSNNPLNPLKQFAIELTPDRPGPDTLGPSQWVVRAQLWHLQLNKLHSLGQISGFISSKVGTAAVMDDYSTETETLKELWGSMSSNDPSSSALDLLNVLSSRQTFNRAYVELAEQLIGALKHAGRKRMAMHASMNFAKFLLAKKDLAKAQDVLTEACKLYYSDKWPVLRLNSLSLLAASQDSKDNPPHEYLTTCLLLACTLPILNSHSQERFFHCFKDRIDSIAKESQQEIIPIQFSLLFTVNCISYAKSEWEAGDVITLTLSLTNKAPADILIDSIKLAYQGKETLLSPIANIPGYWTRLYSYTSLDEIPKDTRLGERSRSRRKISKTYSQDSSNFDFYFTAKKVTLVPGENNLVLSTKCRIAGTYHPDDLIIEFSSVQFRHSTDPRPSGSFPTEEIEVVPSEAKLALSVDCPGGFLLAGKPSEVTLNIFNEGKTIILCGSTITLSSSQLLILDVLSGEYNREGECYQITLPDIKVKAVYQVRLQVRCDPEALKPENILAESKMHSSISEGDNTMIRRVPIDVELPKDSLYTLNSSPGDDTSCGCVLQLTATCNWVNKKAHHNYGAVIPLAFYLPFKCKYDLFSSGDVSFVKLTLQSTTPLPILLRDMKVKQTSVLKSLMTCDQLESLLHPGDVMTLLYQVDKEFNPVLSQICQLLIQYSLVGQEETILEHSFRFKLHDIQSMFILTSQIELSDAVLKKDQECKLSINIKNIRDLPRQWQAPMDDIVVVEYELRCENGNWELGEEIHGSLRLQPMKNASEDLKFRIRPLTHGQLPLPNLFLTLKSYTWNNTSSYITAQFSDTSSPADVPYTMIPLTSVQVYNSTASMVVPIHSDN
ncbi:Trafficking protein particle complex subunit 10 [Oopsacas minuta]|uniref:Trafficking protein particle complex subunit 10 n=1 Tax=Oopsacas minuta TaxID=111878 RepID=A0AAV7K153_9METZ|nr:Trafficking protein particle complex subunit 10 [Oopsacas minuta]